VEKLVCKYVVLKGVDTLACIIVAGMGEFMSKQFITFPLILFTVLKLENSL